MNSINPAIRRAIQLVGLAKLAKLIDATPSQVSNWRTRGTPTDKCAAIEQATNGQVTRKDLRPNDWKSIWPELAKTKPSKQDKKH